MRLSALASITSASLLLALTACTGDDTKKTDAGSDGAVDGAADGGAADGTADGGTADGAVDGGTADGAADGGTADGAADGGTDTGKTDGEDTGPIDTGIFDPPTGTGMLRLANLGQLPPPTTGAVDIFIDGLPASITIPFGGGTPYVETPGGIYDIDIVPEGGIIDDSVARASRLRIDDGSITTLVVAGFAVPPEAGDQPISVIEVRDPLSPPTAGRVQLQLLNGAAQADHSVVDIWGTTPDCSRIGTSPQQSGVAFGYLGGLVELDSTALNLGVDLGRDGSIEYCFPMNPTVTDQLVNLYMTIDGGGNALLVMHFADGSTREVRASLGGPPPGP